MIVNMCGSARELNYCVKRYANISELPAAGRTNEIAVITDTPISSWIFDCTEPEEKTEGMLWFRLGPRSDARFNASRENAVYLRPVECTQYCSGKGVNRKVKSFVNGEWKSWTLPVYYYEKGKFAEDFVCSDPQSMLSLVDDDTGKCVNISAEWTVIWCSKLKYDLSKYSYLRVKAHEKVGGANASAVGFGTGTDNMLDRQFSFETGKTDYTFDISSETSEAYIKIIATAAGGLGLYEISLL